MKSFFFLTLLALCLLFSPLILAEEEKNEIPKIIPDLLKAIFSQKIQLTNHLAPNCSTFPNGTQEEEGGKGMLSLFTFIPHTPGQPSTRGKGEPLVVAEEGSPLAGYVPLMNRLNHALEAATGTGIPYSLRLEVVRGERKEGEPAFATLDLRQGLFLLNGDLLRYLPATPSASLEQVYQVLGERLSQARPEDFTLEHFPQLLKEHYDIIVQLLQQDPIACFFCVVVGGTLVALLANILAYRYSLRVCALCGFSEAQCFYVSLYYLMLVYQNLPLLAAILFALCYDVCVALPHLLAASL